MSSASSHSRTRISSPLSALIVICHSAAPRSAHRAALSSANSVAAVALSGWIVASTADGSTSWLGFVQRQSSGKSSSGAKSDSWSSLILRNMVLSNACAQLRANITIASEASYHSSPVGCSALLGVTFQGFWIYGYQPLSQELQTRLEEVSMLRSRRHVHGYELRDALTSAHCLDPPLHFMDIPGKCVLPGVSRLKGQIGGRQITDYNPDGRIDALSCRYEIDPEHAEHAGDSEAEAR